MNPYIKIQIFALAVMLDFIFRFAHHRAGSVENLIALVIHHRRLRATEIILQREACPTVFEDSLHKFRILFVFCFDFCHKCLILCVYTQS